MRRHIGIIVLVVGLGIQGAQAAPLRQAPPLPINYGQTVEGELNDVQQALQYIFDAEAGDSITILMQTKSGDLNAALSLSTFEGDVVAEDDDSGGGTDALIQVTLEQAASYVITATRSRTAENGGGAGTFSLSLTLGTSATPEVPVQEVGARLQPILRGTQVQGALTPEEAFTLFWFEGSSGETISLVPDSGTNLQPLLALYDSGFTELKRNLGGAPLSATLSQDDLYFLVVGLPDETNEGGNYAITLESGTPTTVTSPPREVEPGQNPIAYGESVRGTINNTAPSFTFQFSGTQGDTVTINMARAGGDLDCYLYLLDSGGVTLAEDDNSGGSGSDARLVVRLPASGEYLILATRRDQASGQTSGNFLLTLESDAVSTPAAASDKPANLAGLPEIAIGETVSGTITNAVFFNPYVFRAEQDDELVMRMESTSDLDPMLLLLNDIQEPLAENDDIVPEQDKNSEITFTIPETGYYVLVATRFEQESGTTEGSYELTLQRADQASAAGDDTESRSALIRRLEAEPIIPGTTPSGAFSPLRFANVYTFGITNEGSLVDLTVNTDNTRPTTVIIADDRLQPIAVTDTGTLLGVPMPSSGNYLIFVAPAGGPAQSLTENYILAFNATGESGIVEATDEPESEPAIPITYNETVTGTIIPEDTGQRYIFSGLANDIIRISMTSTGGGLDPLVRVLDADENVIGENDDIVAGQNRDSLLQLTLPEDGEYTILATHFIPTDGTPASSGTYELTLSYVDPAAAGINPTVQPIQPGVTVTNTVSADQYLMFYSFNGNSGDVVTIEMDTLSGDLDGVMYLYTYTSAGEPIEIARNDDSPLGGTFDPLIQNFTLPRTGTYLIAVGRFPEGTSTGDFALTLTITPAGGADPLETPVPRG